MPCYSPLKGYKNLEGALTFKKAQGISKMEVACGQCLGCRLDRSRMWAMRITHEATLHDHNSFVTLTYDNEHIPNDWSLQKQHFQKFIKRLRKKNPGKLIKYYHAGEYGQICKHGFELERQKCPLCNLGRPHYHACLFNISFTDQQPYSESYGNTRYTSKSLEETWSHGFVDVGKLEYQSAAYVARYIMKKITGAAAEEHYENIDQETGQIIQLQPEYSTMSNGIGAQWLKQFKSDCYPSDEIPVPGTGVIKKAPRYYDELLKKSDPKMLEEVKENRQKYKRENASEYTPERLMAKYKVKKAQTSNLLSRN